jgi:hypothetical protein
MLNIEQETFIQTLTDENRARNAQFRQILLVLPVAATIPYIIALFRPATFLLAILSVTSLISTAFLVYKQEPGETGIDVLDKWSHPNSPHNSSLSRSSSPPLASGSRQRSSSFSFTANKSPLELYLPYMNLGLCVILILTGVLTKSYDEERFGRIGLGNLPAIIFAVVLAAKMVMGSVDPEQELGGLKYEFKGA